MADKTTTAGAVASPEETAAARDAQETEYGTWVALCPISYNGAPAYNAGDVVPASNVARHKYDEQGVVGKADNKDAQAIVAAIHNATTTQSAAPVEPVSLGVTVK